MIRRMTERVTEIQQNSAWVFFGRVQNIVRRGEIDVSSCSLLESLPSPPLAQV